MVYDFFWALSERATKTILSVFSGFQSLHNGWPTSFFQQTAQRTNVKEPKNSLNENNSSYWHNQNLLPFSSKTSKSFSSCKCYRVYGEHQILKKKISNSAHPATGELWNFDQASAGLQLLPGLQLSLWYLWQGLCILRSTQGQQIQSTGITSLLASSNRHD